MRRAVDPGVRGVLVVTGVILGVAAVLAVLAVGFWSVTWDRDPSPESEVRKFLSDEGVSEVVIVRDCRHSNADSAFSLYLCDLSVAQAVTVLKVSDDPAGEPASLRSGSWTYCFDVPRATREPLSDRDRDASLVGRARGEDCVS